MDVQQPNRSFLHKRLKSFAYAFQGFIFLFKNEHNSRIHLLAGVLVTAAGIYYDVGLIQWAILTVCICGVFVAELFNTAIEKTIDLVSPGKNPVAGMIKDLSAAAVLVTAIGALICGGLVFYPYIFKQLS